MTPGRLVRRALFPSLVACAGLLPTSAMAAGAAMETLPPRAREAFARGNIATSQRAWEAAVDYFEEAHRLAPAAPQVLYALGTAHRLLRHPVVAVVFLRAYLEASPESPIRERVEGKIAESEVHVDRLAKDLFEQAATAAAALPDPQRRAEAVSAVVRRAAWAGQVKMVRALGLEHPSGIPHTLAKVAVDIAETEEKRAGVGLGPAAEPRELLELAEELAAFEARDMAASDTPRPRCRFCTWPLSVDPSETRRWEKQRGQAWRKEEPQRRAVYEAESLIGLTIYAARADALDVAVRACKKAQRLLGQTHIAEWFFECRSTLRGFSCRARKDKRLIMIREGLQTIAAIPTDGKRFPCEFKPGALRFVRQHHPPPPWREVAVNRSAQDPVPFQLYDPAHVSLFPLVQRIKAGPLQNAPEELARLGGRLATAGFFLRYERR